MDVFAEQLDDGFGVYYLVGDEKVYPSFVVHNSENDEKRIFLCQEDEEKCFAYMNEVVADAKMTADAADVEEIVEEVVEDVVENGGEVIVEEKVEVKEDENTDSEVK